MVRLTDLTAGEADFLESYETPKFDGHPFTGAKRLKDCRVAMVTTAGLRLAEDRPFRVDATDYRLLPTQDQDRFVMDHVAGAYDRTGFAQDLNTVLPLDRLAELASNGTIKSVADTHYSFMGAGDIQQMAMPAKQIAKAMKADGVNTVVLSPV